MTAAPHPATWRVEMVRSSVHRWLLVSSLGGFSPASESES